MADLAEGQAAPEFQLPRDGGETVRLAELRGKIVVLFFYPKDDTTGCTAEAIDFTRHLADFEKAGAIVLGMSPDSVDRHERFKSKHKLGIPLVSDEMHRTLEDYGVWAEKNMFGRTHMGVVRSTFLIDRDGTIAKIWRNVRVPGHAGDVLAAARKL